MPSKLRSETARINGAKSRGPKSPETRQKSSQGSLQHGLTATRILTLDCESPEEFKMFVEEFTAMHQPANAAEQDLVDQMVSARWRIRRVGIMETGLLDTEMATRKSETLRKFPNADTAVHMSEIIRSLADGSKAMALLSRYESRLQRTYERAYKTLRELQAARKSAEQEKPVAQADSLPKQDTSSAISEPPANSLKTQPTSRRVIEIEKNRTNPRQAPESAITVPGSSNEHTSQESPDDN